MAIIEIDGFKVYSGQNGRNSIIINSDYIKECMEVYIRYGLNGVAITTDHGYKLNNVDFLSDYRAIKHLSISDGIASVTVFKDKEAIDILGLLYFVNYHSRFDLQ